MKDFSAKQKLTVLYDRVTFKIRNPLFNKNYRKKKSVTILLVLRINGLTWEGERKIERVCLWVCVWERERKRVSERVRQWSMNEKRICRFDAAAENSFVGVEPREETAAAVRTNPACNTSKGVTVVRRRAETHRVRCESFKIPHTDSVSAPSVAIRTRLIRT